VIFVFLHMYHHFINGGVGLRHLCDWVMLLHAHKDDINRQELQKQLRSFRLLRAWRIFTPIAVHYLGLLEMECPFYSVEYSRKSDRILAMILREGNFGRYAASTSKLPRSLMHRKFRSLLHYSHRSFILFPFDPLTVTAYYCGYIYRGTKRVLKEI
ncbi:MAG: nucleotidyltransferase family protein, partial [Prevotella sp.]|nr:nucleotidyltransferase family protein [Prevotella sp.]